MSKVMSNPKEAGGCTPPKKRKIVPKDTSSPVAVPTSTDKITRSDSENRLNTALSASVTSSPNQKGTLKRKRETSKPPLSIVGSNSSTPTTLSTNSRLNRVTKCFSKKGSVSRATAGLAITPKYFGRPLDELLELESEQEQDQYENQIQVLVPRLVVACIDFLIPSYQEGIFRKSGSSADIQSMNEAIDASAGLAITDLIAEITDCHTVTGLIKSYIRQLPDSPVPETLHPVFLESKQTEDVNEKMEIFRKAIGMLSPNDFELLKTLCMMLYKIALDNETNKMTASNLAVCWSPNIFKSTSPLAGLSGLTNFVDVLEFMVLHTPALFGDVPDNEKFAARAIRILSIPRRTIIGSDAPEETSDNVDTAGSEEKENDDASLSSSVSKLLSPSKKDRRRSERTPSPRKEKRSKKSPREGKEKTPTRSLAGTLGRSSASGTPTKLGAYDSQTFTGSMARNFGDSLKSRFSSLNKAVQGSPTHARGSIFGLFEASDAHGEAPERKMKGRKSVRLFDGTDSNASEYEQDTTSETSTNLKLSSVSFSTSASTSPRFATGDAGLSQSESSSMVEDGQKEININGSFRKSFFFKSPPLGSPGRRKSFSPLDSLTTSSESSKTSSPRKRSNTSELPSPRDKTDDSETSLPSLAVTSSPSHRRGKTTLRSRKMSTSSKRPAEFEISVPHAAKKSRVDSENGVEKVITMYHNNDNTSDQMAAEMRSVVNSAGINLPVATEISLSAAIKELETVKFLASVSNNNTVVYEGLVSDLAEHDMHEALTDASNPSMIRSPTVVVRNLPDRDSVMLVGFTEELWSRYLVDSP